MAGTGRRPAGASRCAVVAVSSGDGLAELFGQLGVQGVVTGGQTLNPSTAELLAAVEAVNADQVVVLPNNKNIIPVAEQVDALTTKTVRVVPTRSMPEALAALVVYDPEADGDEQRDRDERGRRVRRTRRDHAGGARHRRPRSARSPTATGSASDRGDGIVAVGDTVGAARRTALLEAPHRRRARAVTVITGADADAGSTADSIVDGSPTTTAAWQVEVHDGGQPLYPYLFGVE